MTTKAKLIRTVYLYLAALISLIFVAVGTGRLLNTGLKYAIFPEAEKKSYDQCNQQPPMYGAEADVKNMENAATDQQKKKLESLLADYENWKTNNFGNACIQPARQNKVIDAITMVLIALPICLLHWRVIKKEKDEKGEE